MELYVGCDSPSCAFHEHELYTAVPYSTRNYEGFTVNRTGADLGQQVVYENLYFDSECSSYVKMVKGQQLQGGPSAFLCHNECHRTTEEDWNLAIAGGYVA
jgi:hypothetical protein